MGPAGWRQVGSCAAAAPKLVHPRGPVAGSIQQQDKVYPGQHTTQPHGQGRHHLDMLARTRRCGQTWVIFHSRNERSPGGYTMIYLV
jgi:hypothetical protein